MIRSSFCLDSTVWNLKWESSQCLKTKSMWIGLTLRRIIRGWTLFKFSFKQRAISSVIFDGLPDRSPSSKPWCVLWRWIHLRTVDLVVMYPSSRKIRTISPRDLPSVFKNTILCRAYNDNRVGMSINLSIHVSDLTLSIESTYGIFIAAKISTSVLCTRELFDKKDVLTCDN